MPLSKQILNINIQNWIKIEDFVYSTLEQGKHLLPWSLIQATLNYVYTIVIHFDLEVQSLIKF